MGKNLVLNDADGQPKQQRPDEISKNAARAKHEAQVERARQAWLADMRAQRAVQVQRAMEAQQAVEAQQTVQAQEAVKGQEAVEAQEAVKAQDAVKAQEAVQAQQAAAAKAERPAPMLRQRSDPCLKLSDTGEASSGGS